MAFTGKATYSDGTTFPELYEDVSDIIGIISPFETPLLDHLGDPQRSANSTVHEWTEDSPLNNRVRRTNYTQIFTATVEVSGSQLANRPIGLADEMDYQKQERLRELIRDLENCVINGVPPKSNPQGDASTRRTMKGITSFLQTNVFTSGQDGFPAGEGAGSNHLTEEQINTALRRISENDSGSVDTIVVGGFQKRRINNFILRSHGCGESSARFRDLVSTYKSDFGVCRVILSRWVPPDTVLLLDSSRIDVLPLAGRSFGFKKLASTGDSESGRLIGEYTLELRNEQCHGMIQGLEAY
ncbi:MAG: hypothetical protein D6800_09370 [Candidatus Zixiibacteriota bacterium]|nr:MAG: hypothetical protein D6800_09370 [candidate division Zixibacteria bacterium]